MLPSCQFDQSHSQCHSDDLDSVLSQIVGGRIREQSDEVNIDQDSYQQWTIEISGTVEA
mgnify:FL=1